MPLTGDGTITARVATEPATNSWTKVGVMFRNTLDVTSAYAMSMVTPSNGAGLQYRTTSGGSSDNTMIAGLAAAVLGPRDSHGQFIYRILFRQRHCLDPIRHHADDHHEQYRLCGPGSVFSCLRIA